jgi:hypothetical protein
MIEQTYQKLGLPQKYIHPSNSITVLLGRYNKMTPVFKFNLITALCVCIIQLLVAPCHCAEESQMTDMQIESILQKKVEAASQFGKNDPRHIQALQALSDCYEKHGKYLQQAAVLYELTEIAETDEHSSTGLLKLLYRYRQALEKGGESKTSARWWNVFFKAAAVHSKDITYPGQLLKPLLGKLDSINALDTEEITLYVLVNDNGRITNVDPIRADNCKNIRLIVNTALAMQFRPLPDMYKKESPGCWFVIDLRHRPNLFNCPIQDPYRGGEVGNVKGSSWWDLLELRRLSAHYGNLKQHREQAQALQKCITIARSDHMQAYGLSELLDRFIYALQEGGQEECYTKGKLESIKGKLKAWPPDDVTKTMMAELHVPQVDSKHTSKKIKVTESLLKKKLNETTSLAKADERHIQALQNLSDYYASKEKYSEQVKILLELKEIVVSEELQLPGLWRLLKEQTIAYRENANSQQSKAELEQPHGFDRPNVYPAELTKELLARLRASGLLQNEQIALSLFVTRAGMVKDVRIIFKPKDYKRIQEVIDTALGLQLKPLPAIFKEPQQNGTDGYRFIIFLP